MFSFFGRTSLGAGRPGLSSSSKATVPGAGRDSCARLWRALAIGSRSISRLMNGIALIMLMLMIVSGRTSSGNSWSTWAEASQTIATLAW